MADTWLDELINSQLPTFEVETWEGTCGIDLAHWRQLLVHRYLLSTHRHTFASHRSHTTPSALTLAFLAEVDAVMESDEDEMDIDTANDIYHNLQSRYVPYAVLLTLLSARTQEELTLCPFCESRVMVAGYRDEVCYDCDSNGVFQCADCRDWTDPDSAMEVDGSSYCSSCASWCHDCDEAYRGDECENCADQDCDCVAPFTAFVFPANGGGMVREDERIKVTLPAGYISDEGMSEIRSLIINHESLPSEKLNAAHYAIADMDPMWQKKDGNFTRRLASTLYKVGYKIPPELLSQVGNIAKLHTVKHNEFYVEFTRDLNMNADDFYHGDSCWWGSYSESRCALKSWGGLAIRTYEDEDSQIYQPSGRAWIQPLNEELRPTHDALNPHAYLVYNCYGNLDGYVAARIVAYLSGMTYRKVGVEYDTVYVNNTSGFLVSDAATCQENAGVRCGWDHHNQADSYGVREKVAADVAATKAAQAEEGSVE